LVEILNIALGTLQLTRFTEKDIKALHHIRNHASVRRYMLDPQPISYNAHVKWVKKNIVDERKLLLFMVKRKCNPLGFTLLKKVSEDMAEIGVIFREASKHPVVPYYSTVITLYIAFGYLKLSALISYVIPGHDRAISLNHSFGAREIDSDKPAMIKFFLNRETCVENENYQKVMHRIKNNLKIAGGDTSPF
jgi:hypothetical protein